MTGDVVLQKSLIHKFLFMASTLAALNTTGKLVGVASGEAVTDPTTPDPIVAAAADTAARFVLLLST